MNTSTLQTIIDQEANRILDRWTAEAVTANQDIDTYIADQLDILEDIEPEVVMTVGAAHLRRMFA